MKRISTQRILLTHLLFFVVAADTPTTVASVGQNKSPAAAARTTSVAENHIAEGAEHYKGGRYAEAVVAFKRAISIKPDLPAAHYNLGLAHEKTGQYMEALKAFQQAVRLDGTSAAAHSRLGAMQNYFGQHAEAARSLQQAIRLKPDVADNYNVLGTVYFRTGQYTEAAATLERGIAIAPDRALYENLASVYQKLGRDTDAAAAKRNAARLTARTGNSTAAMNTTARAALPLPTPQRTTPVLPTQTTATTTRTTPATLKAAPNTTAPKGAAKVGGGAAPNSNALHPNSPKPNAPNGAATATNSQPVSGVAGETLKIGLTNAPPIKPDLTKTDLAKPATAKPESTSAETTSTEATSTETTSTETTSAQPTDSAPVASPTKTYRVGVGDVLDIRLLNAAPTGSTLFTVLAGGLLDYPLAGKPVVVAGLQPHEVAARLAARITLYDDPEVVVGVREYASHTVTVAGLVNNPGTKILRHEAVPLYVILAEAQPRAEANRVVVSSPASGENRNIALDDPEALKLLVRPNDIITLQPRPPQFYYISGEVNDPGEKTLRAETTLMQAVLAAGIFSRLPTEVEISRKGADGATVVTRYNLRHIRAGKTPDPRLQSGDWIEVIR